MDKIRLDIEAAKRLNPIAVHARRRKGGPHWNRCRDCPSCEEWLKEIDQQDRVYRPEAEI